MSRREAWVETRKREADADVVRVWLGQLPAPRWSGTAAALADELHLVKAVIGARFSWPPEAIGATRWLEDMTPAVTALGWSWTSRRTAKGRVVEFRKGADDAA